MINKDWTPTCVRYLSSQATRDLFERLLNESNLVIVYRMTDTDDIEYRFVEWVE